MEASGSTLVEREERLVLLFSRDQIQERVRALARAIREDYRGRDLVVIGVLKGAFVFAADLIRALHRPVTVDFVGVSSYGTSTESSGEPRITKPLQLSIAGKDVLVVDDILDTGLSMKALLNYLRAHSARSVRTCALIDKRERRSEEVPSDYVGFEVPGGFVVGYGIDYAEKYRYLPEVYRLEFEEPGG
jgi:hypoxanthine phosphoribosyltransferase